MSPLNSFHKYAIFQDMETLQVIRINDNIECAKNLTDSCSNIKESKPIVFNRKDITNKVADLRYLGSWCTDDWIYGFRARAYFTEEENRECAFKMNHHKAQSITMREYLKTRSNENDSN